MNEAVKIKVKDLNAGFGEARALKNVSLDVFSNEILTVIGPANSGKSTLLLVLNRMIDRIAGARVEGRVLLEGADIYASEDVENLRRRIGMVYAMPIPLPMSIRDNILLGPGFVKRMDRTGSDEIVERSLKSAFLWDEVKDRLKSSALNLSGGQQQRLCIARSLALEPEVIMFDEPCSGLDPISTAKVEDAMKELKKNHTLILVTNNTKQAARVGGRTAFLLMGELVELDATEKIFTNPSQKKTEEYVTGKFG